MTRILLQDVEAEHRLHPRTYSIPRSEQRLVLKVGQLVKLVFLVDPQTSGGATGERMWVCVKEAKDGQYIGSLDNKPRIITTLNLGDDIHFGPEHVAALDCHPEGYRLPYGKYAIVNKSILDEGGWPSRVIRNPPPDDSFSGWWILTGKESQAEMTDHNNFEPILVDELISQFRVLDSVLDEPVGTQWEWSDSESEYVRAPEHE
jgi:hypothetical protein